MINLEYYKKELKKCIYDYSEGYGGYYKSDDVAGGIRAFISDHPEIWEGDINAEEVIDWFLEEHIKPIKLTKLEKDILENLFYSCLEFCDYPHLLNLRKIGHFKGVENTKLKIKDILENCEVVDDD